MFEYNTIRVYHAYDNSTLFLTKLSELGQNYIQFDEANPNFFVDDIKNYDDKSLIIFAGHGFSDGLYQPCEHRDEEVEYLLMNAEIANFCFQHHDVILLSCRSNQFIKKLGTYSNIIGFGNILSSMEEIELFNKDANSKIHMSQEDVIMFNAIYTSAILKTVELLQSYKIPFDKTVIYIRYFVNQDINQILLDDKISNKREIARQLFKFRNEIVILKGYR